MVRVAGRGLLAVTLMLAIVVVGAGIAGAAGTKWGIPGGKLGNGYNPPRHNGEDILQSRGTVIKALHRGCVVMVDNSVQGYNQVITVRYEAKGDMGQRWVLYGHVLQGSQRKEGSCFRRGDVLAKIGTRSDALGSPPHAHIQVWKNKSSAFAYDNPETMNPAPVRQAYGEL
jgi:murein DD-endopeptidase MepM/ murein hydrolase activator NlpD